MNNVQLQLLAAIMAANARVLGMQAANQQRQLQGDSLMYSEDHFMQEAQHLEILSTQALNS